jgi:hypothetical protein
MGTKMVVVRVGGNHDDMLYYNITSVHQVATAESFSGS